MGYFKQYDDIVGYTLEEIVIAYEYQNKGLGSILLTKLEQRVREKGAACVELQAVNDEHHENFFGKTSHKKSFQCPFMGVFLEFPYFVCIFVSRRLRGSLILHLSEGPRLLAQPESPLRDG